MALPNRAHPDLHDGFEGEIAGLDLPDLIQLGAHNRFSGCIDVRTDRGSGLIFLRDGEIVHAERGAKIGEEAFQDILRWTAGRFSLQPNVSSTRSTIKKGWQHLLLDACRVIDEARAGHPGPPPAPGVPPAGHAAAGMEQLRRIPGVAGVVLQRRDGAPLGDDSYQAEVLAGQALYLAMVAEQLGAAFRAGEVLSASVRGERRHLLLFASRGHLLTVAVHGEAEIGLVETEVRRLLGGSR
jgi:predicted regulator of Ras-like GTPase activity (Roadblock/LC7/MglB family)